MEVPVAVIERTKNFYEWELEGRGWREYAHRVPLEPAFRPFTGHALSTGGIPDDGRKPTRLSSLWDGIRGSRTQIKSPAPASVAPEPPEVLAERFSEIDVLIPADAKLDPGAIPEWVRSIAGIRDRIAFELVAHQGGVAVRMAAPSRSLGLVAVQLRAFFPDATIRETDSPLHSVWANATVRGVCAIEFGLAREFMLPLREVAPKPDPLTPIVAALSQVKGDSFAVVQVLFEPVSAPWASHAAWAVTSPDGTSFFADAPRFADQAETKLSAPLYATCLRLLVNAATAGAAESLAMSLASALNQYSDPTGNAFTPLASDDLERLTNDILTRSTHRSGMLLSLPELASLVRIPTEHLRHPALVRTPEPDVILPAEVLGDGVILGDAKHRKSRVPVRLTTEARTQHMYVIGGSGTGKSTLLEQVILQDIEAGRGVGVLDPHGDLVDEVLGRIPPGRMDDVILFDPSDPDYVVGWNILGAHSDIEKELLSSDLVAVFKRQATSWGDQMTAVLGNAVLAFLESSRGGTLSDLRKFLLDDAFRTAFLGTVQDDHVRSFWEEEFPLLIGKKPQAPILTRLDTFLRSRLVRGAVTEREKGLNFRDIIDGQKIFLAKLSQGAIGEENAALLGSLLVSKFHQVSLSRADIAESDRRPFYLFMDEFHHVATPSMAGLFSGVRKYRLAVTVSHQDLYQLHANAPEVERSLLASAYTRVVFRVSDEDARKLERGMGDFEAEDLTDLGRGEAVVRVGRREHAFELKTRPLPEWDDTEAVERRVLIRRRSMERYGRPRAETSAPLPVREHTVREHEAVAAPAPEPGATQAISSPSKPANVLPPEPSQGRGGPTHKYLQSLIRESAQAHGFKAEIEKELPNGKRIDVFLSRNDLVLGCEIAGSTFVEQELGNLRKCLAAGCAHACSVSMDASFLRKFEKTANGQLTEDERARVHFFSPQELMAFLAAQAAPVETRVAGYRVEVRRAGHVDAEQRRAIADVMMKSVRRMREKK